METKLSAACSGVVNCTSAVGQIAGCSSAVVDVCPVVVESTGVDFPHPDTKPRTAIAMAQEVCDPTRNHDSSFELMGWRVGFAPATTLSLSICASCG